MLARLRRLWAARVVQTLAVVIVLVAAAGSRTDLPHTAPLQVKAPEQVSPKPPLPLSVQARSRLRHSRMTGASMTSHNLTAAHFVGRLPADKVSAKTQPTAKHG